MGWTPPWSDKEEPENIIEMARFLRNFNTWDDSWSEDAKLPPPLSKEVMANLPEIKIKSNGKEQCPVCLKPFERGNKAKLLPCRHVFHRECILPWLEETCLCPLCEYELRATDRYKYEMNIFRKGGREGEDLEFVSSFYNCLLTMLYITCKRFITLYEHLIQKINKKI